MFTKCLAVLTLIAASAVALSDEVVLTSGEVLKVTSVKTVDGRVEMDHALLGHLSLPAEQVTTIRVGEGTTAKESSPTNPAPPPPPPPPSPEPPKWKSKAELGINGTSGNTRTSDLRAAIGTKLETPTERWVFDGAYLKSRSGGETTKKNWYAQGLHDWLFKDSPWLVFVTARYDWDAFQQWDKRVQAGVGVGYKLYDTEDLKVRLRAGFNEVKEYGSDDDSWRPEGLLGAEGSYQITKSQSVTASVVYYPDLKEFWKYRIVGQIGYSIKLNDEGLSMMLGATDEIDSHRVPPAKKQDVKYFLALMYEF